MSNIIILRHNGGQLCNQLANFASIYAFCLEKNHRLYNPTFYEYSKYFEHFRNNVVLSPTNPIHLKLPKMDKMQYLQKKFLNFVLSKRSFGTFMETADEGPALLLPPSESEIGELKGRFYFFCGWFFRNPKGREKYKKEIKRIFEPHREYRKNIDKLVGQFPANRMVIAVHIRHRDYRTHEGGKYFFSIQRYNEEMEKLKKRYKKFNPFFVVFSDEQRKEAEFEAHDVLVARGNLIEDLYSMSKVDLVIGPPSTFNMWAAWYGDIKRYEIGSDQDPRELDKYVNLRMEKKRI